MVGANTMDRFKMALRAGWPGSKAQTATDLTLDRQNVAVHVGGQSTSELLGCADQLVGGVVDQDVRRGDVWVVTRHVIEDALKQSLGQLL